MSGLRAVEIAETARGFRVSTDCKSRPEAIAAALALFNMPQASAYIPPPGSLDELRIERGAVVPELPPEVTARIELDSDDAAPEPMPHDEAMAR